MVSFIKSCYQSDADLTGDSEIQAWFTEAATVADVIDFPCSPSKTTCTRLDLIGLLAHIAHLTVVVHHVLNTGDLTSSLGVLPFHPAALYSPIPSTKNISSILPFLPPAPAAIFQINLLAAFNRPQFEAQNKTLAWAYSDPAWLAKFANNRKVASAAIKYQSNMLAFSAGVRARRFGEDGLWNGMPSVWKGVDPGAIPYFFAI